MKITKVLLFIFTEHSRLFITCKNWICGTIEESKSSLPEEEKKRIRDKMTSIAEKPRYKLILNTIAVAVSTLTVFLIGFYH